VRAFLAVSDLTADELVHVLDRADELRAHWRANTMPRSLANERVALWFFGSGFRNRMAFEIGARAMGAEVSFVPGELGVHEPLEDIGDYLQNWFTLLVVRAKRHGDLVALADQVAIPVVNARTNYNHPCEIIGDLQYIRRKRGSLDGLVVVFVGEASNLCMSWFEAATRLPISVTQIAPPGYEIEPALLQRMQAGATGRLAVSHDLDRHVHRDTDVLYTDCWPSIDGDGDVASTFLPYQIDTDVLARMGPNAFFLPCPPVTRGQEVTAEAMKSPLCLNYAAKENLLHAQNAIMEYLVRERASSGSSRGSPE
jgi:ornithine carbamoyltransferase